MNSKIKLFRLLYNNSCGDYSFDDEFFPENFHYMAEYKITQNQISSIHE